MEPTFNDVDDTLIFRTKVAELETESRKLGDRSQAMLKGYKQYKDSLKEFVSAQMTFCQSLHDFYIMSADGDEGQGAAGAEVKEFIHSLRDIARVFDTMKNKLDHTYDSLSMQWNEGLLSSIRDTHKQYEKRQTDMEDLQAKHLGTTRKAYSRKTDQADKLAMDFRDAKVLYAEARYEVARKMNEMQARRKYSFIKALHGTAINHKRAYTDALAALGANDHSLDALTQAISALELEEESEQKHLESVISRCKDAAAEKAMLASMHAMEMNLGTQKCGPVQMSASKQSLSTEIEAQIRAAQDSNGTVVSILRQGYLYKRSTSGKQIKADWKRRYFVLDSYGLLYYYSQKVTLFHKLSPLHGPAKNQPTDTVNLITSTVKMDDDEGVMNYCFRVVSPEGTYTLQAENNYERQEWVETLQAIINCLIHCMTTKPSPSAPVSPEKRLSTVSMGSNAKNGGHRRTASRSAVLPDVNTAQLLYNSVAANNAGNKWGGSGTASTSTSYRRINPTGIAGDSSDADSTYSTYGTSDTLHQLRQVPGNNCCADCGAVDPVWASLNLVVLLCIECSAVHRQLGVHLSKVRSCTLDVKVWEPPVVEAFEALGNSFVNSVWEARAAVHQARSGSAAASRPDMGARGGKDDDAFGGGQKDEDSWVWSEDDFVGGGKGRRGAGGLGNLEAPSRKPHVTSSLSEKQTYIKDKYVERRFVIPLAPATSCSVLWQAVEAGDIRAAVTAVAGGADVLAPHHHLRAQQLALAANHLASGTLPLPLLPPVQPPTGGLSSMAALWHHGSSFLMHCVASQTPEETAAPASKSGSESESKEGASIGSKKALGEAGAAAESKDEAGVGGQSSSATPEVEGAKDKDGSEAGGQASAAAHRGDHLLLHRGLEGAEDGAGADQPPALEAAAEGKKGSVAKRISPAGMAEYLLQNGAQIGEVDHFGRTPLHYAILFDSTLVAKMLLRRGARDVRDASGCTAFDLAVKKGRLSDEELFVLLSNAAGPT